MSALTRAGLSDVDASVRRRAEYSSDASNYRVVPEVVAFPRHVDEVVAAAEVAREHGVPLTSRGGGTSTAGNAVGAGLVLDLSRHLHHVESVDPEARTAKVQPGAVLDTVTAAAAPYGLRFGPDPSTHARATVGGSLGNNACGSRALAYGRSAEAAVELDVLTGNGTRLTARRFDREGLRVAGPVGQALADLVEARLAMVRTEFGRFSRQVSGYSLEHLLPENGADLARFLVGSEGTLATTLAATVRLVESPPAVALAVLGYADLPAAADAVLPVLAHGPVAVEGMDARMLDVLRRRRGPAAVPDLPRGSGWLFVETSGTSESEAVGRARSLIADAGALDAVVVVGATAQALWRIREDGAGLGSRTPAGAPAWPGWEDAAVPPPELGAYLREFTALLGAHGLDALVYGHFGDGCVHARIDFPLAEGRGRFRAFLLEAAALVAAHGGSMSGEHGDGRARSELLPFMYSAEAIDAFARVKAIFDPDNRLNPGVLVDPAPVDANLRLSTARPIRTGLGFAYAHDNGDFSQAVHRCVGVGKCRADTTAVGGVMCPSYLATRDEKDSTRGRARVLQELANGSLVEGFGSPAVEEVLDLCLSCKGCSVDCPAGVDMATYKAEALHQRYRRRPASGQPLRPRLAAPLGPRGRSCAPPRQRRHRQPVAGAAGQADGRGRPPPPVAGLRRPDVPLVVRRPPATAGDAGPAVGRHVHQPLQPRGGPGRRAGAGGRRVRRPAHRRCRVLRPDLDQHRAARRCAPPAAPDARRPRAGPGCRRSDRRSGAVVHGRAPIGHRGAAAERRSGPTGFAVHGHAGRAPGPDARLVGAVPGRRAGRGSAALSPACGHGLDDGR